MFSAPGLSGPIGRSGSPGPSGMPGYGGSPGAKGRKNLFKITLVIRTSYVQIIKYRVVSAIPALPALHAQFSMIVAAGSIYCS